ncbi:hypothetical protein BDFG_05021 [Blastomyces dermatitidis ATCC 26199]|nr:hypothetical protein BDFG_05021 [Blastomyces dermatitidis ATCC 26199]
MVNLRSGGTPDLTKEYVPPRRRNEKTPEQQTQDHRSLPTPTTNRKVTAPGAFEPDNTIVEEWSDESNNEYEDPVEGISEMSGNAGGPSGRNDNGSVSEETRMRLEIARLQHEVERMKTGRGENEELSADLVNYLQ